MFVDRVFLTLEAGDGGNGAIQWARRKYVPKGGPSGGNGGAGGSVFCKVDEQMGSLERWAHAKPQRAEPGRPGGGEKSTGRSGQDLILPVPRGTLLRDAETLEVLADLTKPEECALLCRGGKGGRGNATFSTPTRQSPHIRTEGTKGECLRVLLELKSIADVGLVGFPNAGKSTLLNALTGADARVGAYPFTTKAPNFGAMQLNAFARCTIADIPGIVHDAHLGRGLGLTFLRHIERTQVLLFVLSASPDEEGEPWRELAQLRQELGAHNAALLSRPYLVALNKMDHVGAARVAAEFATHLPSEARSTFEISAMEKTGLEALGQKLKSFLFQLDSNAKPLAQHMGGDLSKNSPLPHLGPFPKTSS